MRDKALPLAGSIALLLLVLIFSTGTALAEEARCEVCHRSMETNTTPRPLYIENPDHTHGLRHGGGRYWCLACHDAENRNKLHTINGSLLSFDQATELCSQCHSRAWKDWKRHIHGRWEGSIENATPTSVGLVPPLWRANITDERGGCPTCHDPHNTSIGKLEATEPPHEPVEPPEIENYNLYALVVLLTSAALAVLAIR